MGRGEILLLLVVTEAILKCMPISSARKHSGLRSADNTEPREKAPAGVH